LAALAGMDKNILETPQSAGLEMNDWLGDFKDGV
jgi:hypothetical protein